MLKKLSVSNFVLIDQLDIQLSKGLSIITGETGAGKSIILGALGLISGQRADVSVLMSRDKKCIVEAVFDVAAYNLEALFEENELDYDPETSLRREINAEGKSRAFVNDTPVALSLLKEISSRLLDIHSQHENLLLSDSKFQMNVLDAFARNAHQLEKYKTAYKGVKALQKELVLLKETEQQSKKDQDYYNFQLGEFSAVKLVDGEQELLEQELERLEHAEEILQHLNRAAMLLRNSDENVLAQLLSVQQSLQLIKSYDETYALLADRINSAILELKDIHAEMESTAGNFQVDPNRMELLGDRLSMIYNLQKKHRVNSVKELIVIQQGFEKKVQLIDSLEEEIMKLSKRLDEETKLLFNTAEELTATRIAAIPAIEKEITKQLGELSMPHAIFKIKLLKNEKENYFPEGKEKVQFLFSANKGADFKELAKVASGGEMSRLMLCVKALMARLSSMPTIIFDEIDTGISGETAARVGGILKSMAKQHQVIAITHLPQLASKGDVHFLVYKDVKKGKTLSYLKQLGEIERINEIARMLSGEALSAAALENAKVLLRQ